MKLHPGLGDHPEEAALIGMIIARWSAIEDTLSQLFAFFTGLSPVLTPMIFGSLQSGRAKIDIAELAGNEHLIDGDFKKEFTEIIDSAKSRYKSRNKYAHALYGIDREGVLYALRRKEGTFKRNNQRAKFKVRPKDLKTELKEADELFNRIVQYYEKLWDNVPLDPSFALFGIAQLRRLQAQSTTEDDDRRSD